jgi:hypothetical protein
MDVINTGTQQLETLRQSLPLIISSVQVENWVECRNELQY